MTADEPRVDSEFWRAILLGTYWQFRAGRWLLKHLPHEPRCKLCAAPFEGAGAPFMRMVGKGRWPKNPKYCGSCFKTLANNHGGAEIPCSLLFADVRGSTQLAESMRPSDFKTLMDRFFRTASAILVEHDAVVDKFVGDEVVAIFIPALTGDRHAAAAIAAARALVVETGRGSHGYGAAHRGRRPHRHCLRGFGRCRRQRRSHGDGRSRQRSRPAGLGSRADEVLVTIEAAKAGDLDVRGLERRDLDLKGKAGRTPVVVLRAPST